MTVRATMPAEWEPHERTLVAWPARASLWRDQLARAKECYAAVIRTIARFEPVMVIVNVGDGSEARAAIGDGHTHEVEIVEEPIDDSWIRDNGPIIVRDKAGNRSGVDFRFNGYGEKFMPYDLDDEVAARLCERLGIPHRDSTMILEGGSIAVDGWGILVTTEQCLLHPKRNPGLSKEDMEHELRTHLGVEHIIWLQRGLVEDLDTDGHVDNLCAFAPRGALLQGTADSENPNAQSLAANRRTFESRDIETWSVDVLPYDQVGGRKVVVPPLNLYFVNGGVIVPVADGDPEAAEVAIEQIARAIPDREVVPIEASVLAYGGGGIHCITQQIPA